MARKKKRNRTKAEQGKLTKIKGIGPATAQKLLTQFKTADGVRKADAPTLQKLLGNRTGLKIFKTIHGEDAPEKSQAPNPNGRKPTYNEALGESIADDYAQGTGTIVEIMEKHGLSERIFYTWKEENLQFFQLIKNAEAMRRGRKKEMALKGMQLLLEGGEYTEQSTEAKPVRDAEGNEKKVIQKTILHRKYQPPSPTMIIFTLCNVASEDFKSVQHIKHERGTELPPYDFSKLSDDELEQFEILAAKATNGAQQ